MRCILFLLTIIISVPPLFSQSEFDSFFTTGAMRFDYVMSGNNENFKLAAHDYFHEPLWAGPQNGLSNGIVRGDFYFELSDQSSGNVIFTQGFNSLFAEWQTTDEAKNIEKAFEGSVRFPYPKYPFLLTFYKRYGYHSDSVIFKTLIDPNDFLIEKRDPESIDIRDIQIYGHPSGKVDLVFLAEGYTGNELEKFLLDVNRFTDFLFSQQAFKKNREKFNVRAVLSVSEDTGPDNPGIDVWQNTILNTGFYTFGSERYLTTRSYWKVCDIAAAVPYDHIIILVNSTKYGGGGIYNHYSLSSAGNELSEIVFVHELGHGLAGLGDEYYTSDVAYSDYYDLKKEPVEPNLTTLVDFDVKWKTLISPGVPLPTPSDPKYEGTTGLFEGGGYRAEGIYRPELNCRMKSNQADHFCGVCQKAIQEMIDYYSE